MSRFGQLLQRHWALVAALSLTGLAITAAGSHLVLASVSAALVWLGYYSIEFHKERMKEVELETKRKSSYFVANLAHEIRTPMTALLGAAELLQGDIEGNSEAEEDLSIIFQSGEHILAMVNDILDMSKIEAGEMVIEKVSCCPIKIIREVIAILGPEAQRKGLSLQERYSDQIPETISSDPVRLRQLLLNLVGNAIKFTKNGSIQVYLEARTSGGSTVELTIRVTDTGIGIPHDKLESIFLPFHQVGPLTHDVQMGTGLGLPICRRLASLLGGELTVESQLGRGSTFTLAFSDDLPDGASLVSAPNRTWKRFDQPRKSLVLQKIEAKILVAATAPESQRLLSSFLARLGADVVVATDGADAVEQCLSQDFDVVLMELTLPVLDGFDAMKAIRARGREVPAIALTAEENAPDAGTGFTDHLAKPFGPEELVARIRSALKQPVTSETEHA